MFQTISQAINVARNFSFRAFFFTRKAGIRSAGITVFAVAILSFACSLESPTIQSAELHPLYFYDPERSETTLFASLNLRIESGSTEIRKLRLEHKNLDLYWEMDFHDDDGELSRLPESGEDTYQSPSFAVTEEGSTTNFHYPWLLSPGENEFPNGIYTLSLWDYSGQRLTASLFYENLDDDALQLLNQHLSTLSPYRKITQGSYEAIDFAEENLPTVEFRIGAGDFLIYAEESSRELSKSTGELFLWGVPAGIDCLVLAGPF